MKIWNSPLSATTAIATSLIAKDAVGCVLYVTQARSNKNMTVQQRADVANYDLANGIINIGIQLLAVKPIEKTVEKFVDSKMMKKLYENLDKKLGDTNNRLVENLLKEKKMLTKGGTAAICTILCQYFIKRVISPFFSVPAGEMTKKAGIVKPKIYPGETNPEKQDGIKK